MSVARDLIIDQLSSNADGTPHLATWYAQGHSDALGDRLLMFDNTSAPSWEILRFKPALARDHRFESGLRERMEQLASFNHPAFPLVRPLNGLGHEDGLAAVSTYSPGLRLSEAMKKPRSAAFAVRLLRQLAPGLAALQEHAPGVFHGTLDAERIVVTAEGRLTIREHMVGAAIARLELSAEKLWEDFHLVAPAAASPGTITGFDGAAEFGTQTDVVQMALLVVSLMVGHAIGPDEYPGRIESLLQEIGAPSSRRELFFFQSLRYWIERALQLDEYSFETAREASDALADLREEPEVQDDFAAAPSTVHYVPSLASALAREVEPDDDTHTEFPPMPARPRLVSTNCPDPLASMADTADIADHEPAKADEDKAGGAIAPRRRIVRPMAWVAVGAAAVGLLALGEAIFIGRLLYLPEAVAPPTAPSAAAESALRVLPTTGLSAVDTKAPDISAAEPTGTSMKAGSATPATLVGTAPQRNGGFRLSSPIELNVLDGDRVLGSSGDGPIVAAAGRHEFEFVNSAIGYRTRHVVEIKAGQITSVSMTVPNGTLNINAVPWAGVWIDGNSFGDTPLGNLSIAPGEHDIVFRHPQLGERREKAIVRADRPTRVTVNLQQP
ncbi:MAG TPA: PEGA domain-containing protein [Vicinamibacterales bacterium]